MPGAVPTERVGSGFWCVALGEVDPVIENGILKAFLLGFERQFNLSIPQN